MSAVKLFTQPALRWEIPMSRSIRTSNTSGVAATTFAEEIKQPLPLYYFLKTKDIISIV